MMEQPDSAAYEEMVASPLVMPSEASTINRATSARSRLLRAMMTFNFSAIRFVLPLRRIPAVSINS